jgi:ergothioneine biosynthesis protein EgtB
MAQLHYSTGAGGRDTARRESLRLGSEFRRIRETTLRLTAPLAIEDTVVQSMPDASPAKWHLAHTTWFFETFLLSRLPGYEPHHPEFNFLFNSYYNAVGPRHCRPKRGLLSRPTLEQVHSYRKVVDERFLSELEAGSFDAPGQLDAVILGLHHEQQHQELIVTDVKHLFGSNPLQPVYRERRLAAGPGNGTDRATRAESVPSLGWITWGEGLHSIGHEGSSFAFDNERPRHRRLVPSYSLADRLVTNGEYLAFMRDGGYERPELWLSDGWNAAQAEGWKAPLYWDAAGEHLFTLSGLRDIDPFEPVCHVSYYEADAFARWAGARLPDEAEWEVAAETVIQAASAGNGGGAGSLAGSPAGNFLESELFHPAALTPGGLAPRAPRQMLGDVWEWTKSPYGSYPGYVQPEGAFGEYNAKFMCNQLVLRGGSCATPESHIRITYRNFFPPEARWQFMGIRLAKDVR